jgi:hypothetical protein
MAEQTMAVWPMTLETPRQQLRNQAMPCETAESSRGGTQSFNAFPLRIGHQHLSACRAFQSEFNFIHLIHIVCFFHILSYSFYRSERLEMQLVSFGFS